MRRVLIAGNWKMNTNRSEAVALAEGVAKGSGDVKNADLLVCPPAIYLEAVGKAVEGSPVALGGQNMCSEDNGAFTGETSHTMLSDVGAKYVILGHSERRAIYGETDANVNDKTKKALETGLIPIVCLGEQLEQRVAGKTAEVIAQQFAGSLADLSAEQVAGLVIAYEPVWAIGTGKVATPEQAEEVHADLRRLLTERYNAETAEKVQILYGGSVKPGNAAELIGQANVDGALVGGASLKADDFLGIATAI